MFFQFFPAHGGVFAAVVGIKLLLRRCHQAAAFLRIGGHTAHLLSYLADANAVALLERQTQFAGERIRVWLLE